jgi:hypothetical protein
LIFWFFCIKYTVFANYQPGKVTCKSSAISGRLFVLGFLNPRSSLARLFEWQPVFGGGLKANPV